MSGINERLGFPFGKMEKLIVAFDVDGTLIHNGYYPGGEIANERIITLLRILSSFKNIRIVVWSGGGKQYAERWVRLLGIEKEVWRVASKTEYPQIRELGRVIAIDDIQDTKLGEMNLIVNETTRVSHYGHNVDVTTQPFRCSDCGVDIEEA
jgi:hydroxymethylpyrimidine pyrophosphatase-like HAD family hydrolase